MQTFNDKQTDNALRIAFLLILGTFGVFSRTATAELVAVTVVRQPGDDPGDSMLYRVDLDGTGPLLVDGRSITQQIAGGIRESVTHVTGAAFHPVTGELFVHQNDINNGNGSLYSVDPADGNAVRLGGTGRNLTDLTFSPDGTLYGWVGGINTVGPNANLLNDLVTLEVALDAGGASVVQTTYVGDSTLGVTNRAGLASNSQGDLYLKTGNDTAAAQSPGNLYAIDATNGSAMRRSDVSGLATNSLVFDYLGDTAYTVDITNTGSVLKTLDVTDGSLTPLGNLGAVRVTALAFNNATAIPEPSSVLLGLTVSVGFYLRRRLRCPGRIRT